MNWDMRKPNALSDLKQLPGEANRHWEAGPTCQIWLTAWPRLHNISWSRPVALATKWHHWERLELCLNMSGQDKHLVWTKETQTNLSLWFLCKEIRKSFPSAVWFSYFILTCTKEQERLNAISDRNVLPLTWMMHFTNKCNTIHANQSLLTKILIKYLLIIGHKCLVQIKYLNQSIFFQVPCISSVHLNSPHLISIKRLYFYVFFVLSVLWKPCPIWFSVNVFDFSLLSIRWCCVFWMEITTTLFIPSVI